MATGRISSTLTALIAVAAMTALPALRAAAVSVDRDWADAFDRAKRETPAFAVESVEEFRKLTEHHASLLSDGVTVASFELPSGDRIQCVEISSQRSLAVSGQPLQLAPGTLPAGDAVAAPRMPDGSMARPGSEFGLDGTRDAAGNERACPAQTFPRLTPRLENLYRFRSLDELFQKIPGGGPTQSPDGKALIASPRTSLAATVHEYAHAYQWANNIGMSAIFNLWSPTVESFGEFSLSQLWVTRGLTSDNSLQTVETGWQNFQQLYGDSRSHLFIYFTTANYQTGTGCYNLTCTGFVQTDSSVVVGGGFTVYSAPGGTQYEVPMTVFRDASAPHHWWVKYNDTWVGYYPNSLFDAQGIANYSDHVDFGGEIVNVWNGGQHTTTDMGSGRFPSEGYGAAAYTKKMQYWDTSNALFNASNLTRAVTNASYYDLSLGSSTDATWLKYFYFGGPGRIAASTPAAPTAAFTFPSSPKAGQSVQFTDTSSGAPTSWSWSFGDGATSSAQNPAHTFGTGTYHVSLTASNSGGSSTKTQSVTATSASAATGCTADAYTMCLVNGRYGVTSHWKNQYAGGAAANLSKTKLTETTGAFWLSDANTYEYLIRFNTATSNGRAWVAIPTFTDVEFWVAVTDTVNGQYKEYHSAPGNLSLIYDPYFFVYP